MELEKAGPSDDAGAPRHPKAVLLTGATGFLGMKELRQQVDNCCNKMPKARTPTESRLECVLLTDLKNQGRIYSLNSWLR
jgi:hypothetical protein